VDLSTLKTIYYSLIYSHLQYCILTWGMTSRNALNPLKKLQKRIVRIITKNSYPVHTNPLFQKLNFLKLKDICTLEIAKKTYSYQINPDLHSSNTLTKITQIHNHNTRFPSRMNYSLPKKRTEFGKRFFTFAEPKIWQDVPTEFKSLNYANFKKKTKIPLNC